LRRTAGVLRFCSLERVLRFCSLSGQRTRLHWVPHRHRIPSEQFYTDCCCNGRRPAKGLKVGWIARRSAYGARAVLSRTQRSQGRVRTSPGCVELCGILGDEAIRRRGSPAGDRYLHGGEIWQWERRGGGIGGVASDVAALSFISVLGDLSFWSGAPPAKSQTMPRTLAIASAVNIRLTKGICKPSSFAAVQNTALRPLT
jgi:hypothetical protein